jgi:pullulanase/glycogen debranching enzyme
MTTGFRPAARDWREEQRQGNSGIETHTGNKRLVSDRDEGTRYQLQRLLASRERDRRAHDDAGGWN